MKKKIGGDCILFTFGGIVYGLIEILWRKYTHWSMLITGGLCFIVLYKAFKKLAEYSMIIKCVAGSTIITSIEIVSGCVFNIIMKLKVWDYSRLPMNLCGQVCLLYSVLWGFLCIPIVFVCTMINRKWKL